MCQWRHLNVIWAPYTCWNSHTSVVHALKSVRHTFVFASCKNPAQIYIIIAYKLLKICVNLKISTIRKSLNSSNLLTERSSLLLLAHVSEVWALLNWWRSFLIKVSRRWWRGWRWKQQLFFITHSPRSPSSRWTRTSLHERRRRGATLWPKWWGQNAVRSLSGQTHWILRVVIQKTFPWMPWKLSGFDSPLFSSKCCKEVILWNKYTTKIKKNDKNQFSDGFVFHL